MNRIHVLSGIDRTDLLDRELKGQRLAVVTGGGTVNADALLEKMNARRLPGARFAKVCFRPGSSKYAGEVCNGLQTLITDRQAFRPFLTALTMLEIIREMDPERLEWADCSAGHDVWQPASEPVFTRYLDKLLATDAFIRENLTAEQLVNRYEDARKRYTERKSRYHLYE